ncbi:HTH-type transcriptional regulator VirS [Massilia sp. Bi118]|uniref:AraC family transcriptional regulator n=1 Tax=Massilia sp. Bi118 TaxID=2822346 RepID=UPI001D6B3999|nr:AraC family transcriptional regulator [Massilia sp. Bi118]CAH0271390.1 HTH-type transcriptional regulator VirS [Massilia sp. Bi118]
MKYLSATDVVQRIRSCLSAEGVDVDGLFGKAGLGWFGKVQADGAERAADLLALSDQFSQLWEGLALASGDPLIGFRVCAPDPLSWLGVLGHLMLASPTLKQAADNLMRYMPLVTPVVRATIEPKSDRVRVGLNLVGGVRPVPVQRYDFTWSLLLDTLRFVGGRPDLKPVAVEYAYPAPGDSAPYAERFGCPVRFGAPANALEFANADITAPIPTANPLAAEGLFRLLDERLVQAERSSFAARVREMLPAMIDQGGALRDAVARRLAISERTLQRRLADEGTDFSTLVDEVRRTIAQQYLGSDRISVKNLSYKLGFSDPSAFHRACLRWFGKAPGEFQQQKAKSA